MTQAVSVSKRIRQKHNITSSSAYFYITSPGFIQIFVVFGYTVRNVIRNFMNVVKLELDTQKALLYTELNKYEATTWVLDQTNTLLNLIIKPMQGFLNVFDIDSLIDASIAQGLIKVGAIDEVREGTSYLLGSVAGSIPFSTSSAVIQSFRNIGVDVTNFFSGVSTLQDIVDKIKLIEFKLARSTSLVNTSKTTIGIIENKLKEFEIYADIMDMLDEPFNNAVVKTLLEL